MRRPVSLLYLVTLLYLVSRSHRARKSGAGGPRFPDRGGRAAAGVPGGRIRSR
jgi:hypothetical protein